VDLSEMLPQQIMKSFDCSPKSRFSMVSLSYSILSSIFSIIVKLTGEFTSLEEPTDDSDIAIVMVFPADGSDFVGSKGESNPRNRCESSDFQSSGPSPDPSLQRPE
jgi:hypothetical protein